MSSNGGNVQVSDAVFELDDLKGSGGITVTFGVPLSIVTQVELDTLDLDSFLVAGVGRRSRGDRAVASSRQPSRRCRPVARAESQGGQADLAQGDDRRHRCRRRPARQHACG